MKPTRLQSLILWATVLTSAHFWLGLDLSNLWPAPGARWGLGGYLYPAYTYHRPEFAFVILVIGALLLWQVSPENTNVAEFARKRRAAEVGARCLWNMLFSTRSMVIACLFVLLLLLVLHFGSAPARTFNGFGKF
jgi:hypothetical protein